MNIFIRVFVVIAPLILSEGCNLLGNNNGVACTEIAAAGLDVVVTNSLTSQPVCGATVTATDGTYSETLFENSCHYTGAYERPGTYTISVTKTGFTANQTNGVVVVMGTGECPHVVQTTVNVILDPVP